MDESSRHSFTSHPPRSGLESPYDERSISSGGSSHGLPPLQGIPSFAGRRPSLTSTGPGPSHSQRMATFAPPGLNVGPHNQPFGPPSASPSAVSSGFQDGLMPDALISASGGASPTHLSSAIISQKRAYRQRRKDPSCDACRERKVKCDATDTSSCSECSSRSVKCQFTKETNRRMSSIKQVQDLEKQLAQAKQTINQLRGMMENGGAMNVDHSAPSVPTLNLPEINPNRHGEQKSEPPALKHFDHVRRNIRNYGRGLFKVPPLYRQPAFEPSLDPSKSPVPSLPPKHIADHLLSQYHGSVHISAPLLHWPTFVREYETVYRNGSFQGQRKIWVSTFFAALACGTLYTVDRSELQIDPEKEGVIFKETSIRYVNTWTDNVTIDHARTCLLLSIFSIGLNYTASGWIWLGSAIRMAQDVGLHNESGPWPIVEAEMRRRVWWSIYALDRIISLELGRPLQIDDDDCDVGLPCPVDDSYIQPKGIVAPPGQALTCGLSALIPVVRMIPQLKKTLKSPIVASGTLDTYDDYLRSLLRSLPDVFHVEDSQHVDPCMLSLCITTQSVRMFLYRHNLSTICSREARRNAIDRCVSVGQDTARFVARSMLAPSSPTQQAGQNHHHTSEVGEYVDTSHGSEWQRRIAAMSPATSCAHLWRCTLFLSLRGHYSSALTILRASAAVGDLKKNNIASGRNLRFFLDRLTERLRAGRTQEQIEDDEEMLAYVSGDMQGGVAGSWVWAGSETGMRLNATAQQHPPPSHHHVNGDVTMSTPSEDEKSQRSVLLTEKESTEWGGWEKIAAILTQLLEEQQRGQQRAHQGFTGQQPALRKPDELAVQPPSGSMLSPTDTRSAGPDGTSPGGSARISIANII